ncbi:MAG: cation diffusion facilitator family transporter [Actinobacteria bacterium]|nr:cation diffusion facilitator family transporter [Actinomycetota bacterium]
MAHHHGHSHHGHDHGHAHGMSMGRALWVSLVLTLLLGVIQIGGAVAFDSLALISDAVHNLSDAVAVLLAVGAAWLAGMPPRGARTFGYRRAEVLAAVVNAVLLIVLSAGLGYEAITRLLNPQPVAGEGVAVISVIAIVLNLIPVLLLLRAGARKNLNANATMLHFASDVLSSFAAFVAGLVIILTGWNQADPIASLIVVALIVVASLRVLRDAVRVLLEEAPPGIDPATIGQRIANVPGVCDVHDLHIWQITDGFPALSAHVVIDPGVDAHHALHEVQKAIASCCDIEHTTIQIDVDHSRGLHIQSRLTQPQEAP